MQFMKCGDRLAVSTGDSCSNEISLQPLAQIPRLTACGRALGTGYSLYRGAPGLDWEQEALAGCYGSPAFESSFLFLDLTLLICSGTSKCSCLQEDEQDLEQGLLQRRDLLRFGL